MEIPPERKLLHQESFRYRGAVSEALLYALGAMCNFLNLRHIETKRFTVGGMYNLFTLPYNAVDGIHTFEFDSEIVNIWIYSLLKGTGGTTELDLKWKAKDSSTWQSIFVGAGGVTPKVNSSAADYEVCGIGNNKPGFVAPVPIKTQFVAGDAIRMDLISSMSGSPTGTGIILNYRPR